jgi:metallo-beta-lactamase class B
MRRHLAVLFCCGVLVCSGRLAIEATAQSAADRHVAIAKAAAYQPGQDFTAVFETLCLQPKPGESGARPAERNPLPLPTAPRTEWFTEPAKVFDNLYYIGSKDDSSWAVTTSAGIIVIDTGFQYSIEELAANGLKKLGLDPANIKYVIVSHAHSDHYLGAKFLQDRYKPRIIMSEADWNVVEKDFYPASAKPKKDMVATDGMKLTLGDTTLTLYVTPGHTPGTVSTLIPLKDGNQTHLGSIWGGMTFGFERAGVRYFPTLVDALKTNSAQARRYQAIAEKAGADVFLSIHTRHDKTPEKIAAVKARRPGAAHPFVSKEAIKRHLTVIAECTDAQVAWRSEK